jgi:hypothetical protein
MLGRLEMDVDECIAEYNELAEKVFGKQKGWFSFIPFTWKGKVASKFSSETLRQSIIDVLEKKGLDENTMFREGEQDRGCKTWVF